MTPLLLSFTLATKRDSVAVLGSQRALKNIHHLDPSKNTVFWKLVTPTIYCGKIRLFGRKKVATEEHTDSSSFARQGLYGSMNLSTLPETPCETPSNHSLQPPMAVAAAQISPGRPDWRVVKMHVKGLLSKRRFPDPSVPSSPQSHSQRNIMLFVTQSRPYAFLLFTTNLLCNTPQEQKGFEALYKTLSERHDQPKIRQNFQEASQTTSPPSYGPRTAVPLPSAQLLSQLTPANLPVRSTDSRSLRWVIKFKQQ